jgi:hypothetical protein
VRRRQRYDSDYVPCFAASGWTDGPSSPQAHRVRRESSSSADSTSSSEPGFFSILICQPSIRKNPRRRHHTLLTSLAMRREKHLGTLRTRSSSSKSHHNRSKVLQAFAEQTVQCIPSMLRLRQTQSAPRIEADESEPGARTYHPRRHSSNPSIGSPLDYPYEISQIRRTSATPAASQYERRKSHVVRLCGRGDLITQDEDLTDSQAEIPLHSKMASMHSTNNSSNILSLPARDPEALSPLAISPRNTTTSPLSPRKDYFASVHAATHIHDDKDFDIDDEDDLKGEREDAGPRIEESPYLRVIFARMDAHEETYMSDDNSNSDDLERDRKRRSILHESGSTNDQIVERFAYRRQESRLLDDEYSSELLHMLCSYKSCWARLPGYRFGSQPILLDCP